MVLPWGEKPGVAIGGPPSPGSIFGSKHLAYFRQMRPFGRGKKGPNSGHSGPKLTRRSLYGIAKRSCKSSRVGLKVLLSLVRGALGNIPQIRKKGSFNLVARTEIYLIYQQICEL